jgi:transposase InsO family protein
MTVHGRTRWSTCVGSWVRLTKGVHPREMRNHLNRDLKPAVLGTKWTANITYIRTAGHWLYLCIVLGQFADNAAVESFVGVLKRERVNRKYYRTRAEARADIFDYVERWHNPRQRRRLEMQHQGKQLLTQPSVEMG